MSAIHWIARQPVSTLAIPVYVISIAVEVIVVRRASLRHASLRHAAIAGFEARDTAASLSMGLISLATSALITAATWGFFVALWHHRLVDLGSGAVGWAAAIIGWDFTYYGAHRAGHRVRILWANHVQHHSSERYNFSTALRQPVTPIVETLMFLPLALLGVSPALIVSAGAISLVYQFFLHTEVIDRLPRPVEAIFNTPSHHRVHHGSNAQYLDKNFGGILIVWDRLFGTFEPEVEPVIYGLTKNITSFNPVTIACHEYAAIIAAVRRTTGIADKVRRIVLGPGWEPAEAARSAAEIGPTAA